MTELIDIGVNLTGDAFDSDRAEVEQRAWEAGLVAMVITGTSEQSSEAALELSRRAPQRLFSTAGVHPHSARDYSAETTNSLRSLAAAPSVVAIGETGLDFNRDFSPRPEQERAFERQLELASELQMPVFLHQRDAHERFLSILRHYRDNLPDAVAHCFTGSRRELWDYLDLDLHIGITGWVCDERRGQELYACVGDIPADRLMLETDAPYLLPRTLRPKPKRGRNEPAFLPEVLRVVAKARSSDAEQIARETTANARQFFRMSEESGG